VRILVKTLQSASCCVKHKNDVLHVLPFPLTRLRQFLFLILGAASPASSGLDQKSCSLAGSESGLNFGGDTHIAEPERLRETELNLSLQPIENRVVSSVRNRQRSALVVRVLGDQRFQFNISRHPEHTDLFQPQRPPPGSCSATTNPKSFVELLVRCCASAAAQMEPQEQGSCHRENHPCSRCLPGTRPSIVFKAHVLTSHDCS